MEFIIILLIILLIICTFTIKEKFYNCPQNNINYLKYSINPSNILKINKKFKPLPINVLKLV